MSVATSQPDKVVRNLLDRAGISSNDAARELGIDEQTMRQWYDGRRTPPRMAILALERVVEMRRESIETTAEVKALAK